jgi:uncharacterized membrane protein YczE
MAAPSNLSSMPLSVRLPRRMIQLYAGLVLYGVSMAIMIRAALGTMPWAVFHQGLALRTGVSYGTTLIVVGIIVLLLWIPLRQWPGIGTVSNVAVIGVVADQVLAVLATPHSMLLRVAFLIGSIVLNGVSIGMYIGARLGPGPRDGLMTGLAARYPRVKIRTVRTGIEVVVVIAGFLLGGQLGVGTILYALTIGPLTGLFLRIFTVKSPAADPAAVTAAGHLRAIPETTLS